MKLSKREIVLLYVLVLALVIFTAVTFIINPMVDKLGNLSKINADLKAEYQMKKFEADSGASLSAKLEKLENDLGVSIDQFFETMGDTEQFRYLSRYVEEKGFALLEFSSGGKQFVSMGGQTSANIYAENITLKLSAEIAEGEDGERLAENFITGFQDYVKSAVVDTCSWKAESECTLQINFTIFSVKK